MTKKISFHDLNQKINLKNIDPKIIDLKIKLNTMNPQNFKQHPIITRLKKSHEIKSAINKILNILLSIVLIFCGTNQIYLFKATNNKQNTQLSLILNIWDFQITNINFKNKIIELESIINPQEKKKIVNVINQFKQKKIKLIFYQRNKQSFQTIIKCKI